MDIHTCLWNRVRAFNFSGDDLEPLREAMAGHKIIAHSCEEAFLERGESAQILLTWMFPAAWYRKFPRLLYILTPAAGTDWVDADPARRVEVIHGTFHGEMLSESLISALYFMNHRMPDMIRNHHERIWDRNIQAGCKLLASQTVLIIGLGNIGTVCAHRLTALGVRVIGVRKSTDGSTDSITICAEADLPRVLPLADHIVLLLPENEDTSGYLSPDRIRQCKPGVYLYNFGRGSALKTSAILATVDHIGGAFLDVVDEEPLPEDSPLWSEPQIMITPHSSCVYREYKSRFLDEAAHHLKRLIP